MADKSIEELRDEAQEAVTELAEALATKHIKKWTPKQRQALTACTRAINKLAKTAETKLLAAARDVLSASVGADAIGALEFGPVVSHTHTSVAYTK